MRAWGLSLDRRAEVWHLWRRGNSVRSIAPCVGKMETKVWRYLLEYGGHAPVLRHRGSTARSCARFRPSHGRERRADRDTRVRRG